MKAQTIKITAVLWLLLIAISGYSQGVYTHFHGGTIHEEHEMSDVTTTGDGNIIFCGKAEFDGSPYSSLVKIDPDGNLLWARKFPPADGVGAWDMSVEEEAGVVVFGIDGQYWGLNLSNGNVLWSKSLPDQNRVRIIRLRIQSMCKSHNSGKVIMATYEHRNGTNWFQFFEVTVSNGALANTGPESTFLADNRIVEDLEKGNTAANTYLARFSPGAQHGEERTLDVFQNLNVPSTGKEFEYPGGGIYYTNQVIELNTGAQIHVGQILDTTTLLSEAYLMKTDNNVSNIDFSRKLSFHGIPHDVEFRSVTVIDDMIYALADFGPAQESEIEGDFLVVKMTQSGLILKTMLYNPPGSHRPASAEGMDRIFPSPDGHGISIIFEANTNSSVFYTKIDEDLNTYGGGLCQEELYVGYMSPELEINNRTIIGQNNPREIEGYDALTSTYDPFNRTSCEMKSSTSSSDSFFSRKEIEFSVYPNPTEGEINVLLDAEKVVRIEIRDVMGRLLVTIPAQTNRTIIPLDQVESGYYLVSSIGTNGAITNTERVMVR